MEKIKKALKSVKDFATGLLNLASFTEWKEKVDIDIQTQADNFNTTKELMNKLSENLSANATAMDNLSQKITNFGEEITKIKDGLQIELFGSLQALHARLVEQHYATKAQKNEAKLYYDQIHKLGKDGWSHDYYEEIMKMPESREEYWKRISENKP